MNADLALEASKAALQDANLTTTDIDFIIYATLSPDYLFPGSGVLLQEKLGMAKSGIGALDIRMQCSGFVYGLAIADSFIKSGQCKRILLVGSEIHSTGLDLSTAGRDVAVLFGDGAGAAILEATEEDRGILTTKLHSDGRHAKELWTESPGTASERWITHDMIDTGKCAPSMNGREVFKHAVTKFPDVIGEALNGIGKKIDDLDLLIIHQANLRIAEAVQKRLNFPDSKIYNNIQRYGNTTAASIPIALTEAKKAGKVKPGSLVCLASFGSGFTWAASVVKW
jgi:3-oxoacyl-[acyl-carrier-protein] synthase-3